MAKVLLLQFELLLFNLTDLLRFLSELLLVLNFLKFIVKQLVLPLDLKLSSETTNHLETSLILALKVLVLAKLSYLICLLNVCVSSNLLLFLRSTSRSLLLLLNSRLFFTEHCSCILHDSTACSVT